MDDLVDVICRDSGLRFARRNVEDLSRQPAHLAHALNLLRIQDRNLVPPDKLLLGARYPILCVVGQLHGGRNLPPLGQRVDWSQASGVWVGGEGIEVAGGWIGVRNDFRGNETGEKRTL